MRFGLFFSWAERWIAYSVTDAESTYYLRETLENNLKKMEVCSCVGMSDVKLKCMLLSGQKRRVIVRCGSFTIPIGFLSLLSWSILRYFHNTSELFYLTFIYGTARGIRDWCKLSQRNWKTRVERPWRIPSNLHVMCTSFDIMPFYHFVFPL